MHMLRTLAETGQRFAFWAMYETQTTINEKAGSRYEKAGVRHYRHS